MNSTKIVLLLNGHQSFYCHIYNFYDKISSKPRLSTYYNQKGVMDMPIIDSKITGVVPKEKKEVIKRRLGKAVSILRKSEGFLMVDFQDQYNLYMGGIFK